jgi:hypothetical protein
VGDLRSEALDQELTHPIDHDLRMFDQRAAWLAPGKSKNSPPGMRCG